MNKAKLKENNNCKIIHISERKLSASSSRSNHSQEKNIYIKDAYLYSWGKNKFGELGLDTLSNKNIPSPITSIKTQSINSVKSGGRNSIILSSDGSLYLCGSNIFGLLANNAKTQNNQQSQKVFKKINFFLENNIDIIEISIAEFHCLALDKKGNVFGWGGNLFNKLGKKYNILQGIPTQILVNNKIKSISCGDYHSCAITQDGVLYSWGGGGESYNKGQCGHGTTKDIQKPKKVEYFIKHNLKVKKVSCGGYHTIVISDSDELFSFGKGIYGQCGYGQQENISTPKKVYFNENQNLRYEKDKNIKITDIKCGGDHSLFLSSNNNLYVCGHGYLGQLGLGNNKNISIPIIVKSLTNKKIIEIAAGWSHSLVLTSENNIYSTGCNKYGELGIGANISKYNYIWVKSLSKLNIKHISAGGHHSWCLLDTNEPLRKNDNGPEPLLKSNFSMSRNNNNNKRKLTNMSNDSKYNISFNDSLLNKTNNLHNKSVISADTAIRRKNIDFDGNEFKLDIIKKKNSQKQLKKIIDDYNNENNNMSIDNLIENIDNINNLDKDNNGKNENNLDDFDEEKKYFINPKESNNLNLNDIHNLDNSSIILDNNKNNIFDYPFNNGNNKENDENINNNIIHNENYNQPENKKKLNDNDIERQKDSYIINKNEIVNKDSIIGKNGHINSEFNNCNFDDDEEQDEDNNKLIHNIIPKNKMDSIIMNNNYNNYELKIIYTDLNLSHRFVRFHSSIDYDKLNNIIKKNFIEKDIGNTSFHFQRDDEIVKNSSITPEINFIFNKMKNENLINLDQLSNSYTLGIVYDYNKKNEINQYKNKVDNNNKKKKENKGPFFGIKIINSKQIMMNKKDNEKFLSKWIVDFHDSFNNLKNHKENIFLINNPMFLELRPNIFNSIET